MSDDKIVAIRGATVASATGTGEPSVIAALERALEQARAGEIVAVGIIKVRPNNHVGHSWECPNASGHMLIAGCDYLKHELLMDTSRVVADRQGE